jgi:hypothetical protein
MARKRRNDPWDACTWEGARREQLRRWGKLTLREKLQAVEDTSTKKLNLPNDSSHRHLNFICVKEFSHE